MFWLIKQLERKKIVGFRHGRERGSGRSSGREPLRHGWGGSKKNRREARRRQEALEVEKEKHPYTSRKFRGDESRDLTPEDRELLRQMRRG